MKMKKIACLVVAALSTAYASSALAADNAQSNAAKAKLTAEDIAVIKSAIENEPYAGFDLGSGFYASGYFRWGTLTTQKGDASWGPTWKHFTGSLANEDNDWHLTLGRFMKGDGDLWATAEITMKGETWQNYTPTSTISVDNNNVIAGYQDNWGKKNLHLTQSYIEIGGFDPSNKQMSIWAGRKDMAQDNYDWIVDWFYTNYLNNIGVGLNNVDLGDAGKLDVAWLQNVIEYGKYGAPNSSYDQTINQLYTRWTKGGFHFDGLYQVASNTGDENTWAKNTAHNGYQLSGTYATGSFYGLNGGWSKYVVQYGKDLGAGLAAELDQNAQPMKKGDSTARLMTFGGTSIGSNTLLTSLYLTRMASKNAATTYLASGVARLIHPVNKFFSMQGEIGGAFIRTPGQKTATFTKVAIAPTFSIHTKNGLNPNVKFEIAYHGGNSLGTDTYPTVSNSGSHEFRIGVEGEIWIPNPSNPYAK